MSGYQNDFSGNLPVHLDKEHLGEFWIHAFITSLMNLRASSVSWVSQTSSTSSYSLFVKLVSVASPSQRNVGLLRYTGALVLIAKLGRNGCSAKSWKTTSELRMTRFLWVLCLHSSTLSIWRRKGRRQSPTIAPYAPNCIWRSQPLGRNSDKSSISRTDEDQKKRGCLDQTPVWV